jgi:capsular polysaccharide export protein
MPARTPSDQRTFLLLQGPLSPLYSRLAGVLADAGHQVLRVNLSVGDRLHWRRDGALDYRGRPGGWPHYVAHLMADRGVSDLLVHGECRFYHRAAARAARRLGVCVWVSELGYLRPDWMTLERDATGAGSAFPRDPVAIRALAAGLPELDLKPRFSSSFMKVAVPDVVYNLANTLLWPLYPGYRRHTIYYPPLEYAAWISRLIGSGRRRRVAGELLTRLAAAHVPIFLFALQLEGDFQVRARSPYRGQLPVLEEVAASFARKAPPVAHLVVKTHPLDNGLEGWRRHVPRVAAELGLAGRLHLVDGGGLEPWLALVAGLVTLNSSAGIEALRARVPVKTLAPAIYDVAGLTHQADLASFWLAPAAPDQKLLADYLKAMVHATQVRGTIYDDAGLDAAVAGMAARLLAAGPSAGDRRLP